MKLANFFYDCVSCGEALRFDDTAQVRICPVCNTKNQLSSTFQKYLILERNTIKVELDAYQLAQQLTV
jgi:hypothetical protein